MLAPHTPAGTGAATPAYAAARPDGQPAGVAHSAPRPAQPETARGLGNTRISPDTEPLCVDAPETASPALPASAAAKPKGRPAAAHDMLPLPASIGPRGLDALIDAEETR
jgi:hypothetical protein